MRLLGLLAFGAGCALLVGWPACGGDKKEEPKKADGPLVVVSPAGKEVKLVTWHFSAGTKRLTWLPVPKLPKTNGPECLEFRDDKSTIYQNGIATLIPLQSLVKLDYDNEKKTVAATVLTAGGKEQTLTGLTKFVGINKLTLEGDADLGDLGSATVKFLGGAVKGGIQSARFPAPKPVPAVPEGRPATVLADDKDHPKHTAVDLQAVYLVDGKYRTLPYLMFKKTVKVELAKLVKLQHLPAEDKKQQSYDFEVTLADGDKHNLTLLTKVEVDGAKGATLVGLAGRVPVGWKLFPPHTIHELRFEEAK